MLQLYTFAISHFSEKARWALDLAKIDYSERILLPGPHMLVTRRIGKSTSVPVLEHDARVVQGSAAILDYVQSELGASHLAPDPQDAEECAQLETLADHAFGLGTQRIFYDVLLNRPRISIDLWSQGGPFYARAFYAVAYKGVAAAIRRMYRIEPAAVERAKDRFRNAMDVMDRTLDSKPYVLGGRLTRADITIGALLAPLCRPPEHLMRWPDMPDEALAFMREFEDRPIYRHVLRLYRDHRRA
ncbi:MAG TPA: glutathione S-transferase [Polyangiaceae bacterium]|nr:glutathione S-transferase [Polyangiaceae bacterium]